jgi:hypothetical protein
VQVRAPQGRTTAAPFASPGPNALDTTSISGNAPERHCLGCNTKEESLWIVTVAELGASLGSLGALGPCGPMDAGPSGAHPGAIRGHPGPGAMRDARVRANAGSPCAQRQRPQNPPITQHPAPAPPPQRPPVACRCRAVLLYFPQFCGPF